MYLNKDAQMAFFELVYFIYLRTKPLSGRKSKSNLLTRALHPNFYVLNGERTYITAAKIQKNINIHQIKPLTKSFNIIKIIIY